MKMETVEQIFIILAVFVSSSGYTLFIQLFDKLGKQGNVDKYILLQSVCVFLFSSVVWLTAGKLFVDSLKLYTLSTLTVVFIFTLLFGEKR